MELRSVTKQAPRMHPELVHPLQCTQQATSGRDACKQHSLGSLCVLKMYAQRHALGMRTVWHLAIAFEQLWLAHVSCGWPLLTTEQVEYEQKLETVKTENDGSET